MATATSAVPIRAVIYDAGVGPGPSTPAARITRSDVADAAVDEHVGGRHERTLVRGEKLRVQFRAEAFNIFNNVNLQPQLRTIFDASGNLVSTIGTALGPTVNTSRQIQFGLKLIF